MPSQPGDCIIEHPTRGVLTDLPGERDDKPHFAWSLPRYQGKVMTEARARLALEQLSPDCYILMYDQGPKNPGWTRRS
jgi:hypothetical protein